MGRGFTPEELEELRRFDEEIENGDLIYEDYLVADFVDDLLFPEKAKEREKKAEEYRRQMAAKDPEELKAKRKAEYARKDKDAERKRKQEWYRKNKERIRLQQKDYRIRSGRQKAEKAV